MLVNTYSNLVVILSALFVGLTTPILFYYFDEIFFQLDFIRFLGVLVIFFISFLIVLYKTRYKLSVNEKITALFTVIWLVRVLSEFSLIRSGSLDSANQGEFSFAAFGEVTIWLLSGILLAIFSISVKGYVRELFLKDTVWLSLFLGLVLISCVYSPQPAYSFAWSFKLLVVVLLATSLVWTICDIKGLINLFRLLLY